MIRKTRLYTPGPTPLLPAAQFAMAAADIHHRTPEFRALFQKVLAQLKVFVGTKNDVLLLSSSGTGAMEASVSNLTSPGDRVLVLTAGKFGERWVDLTKAFGCEVDVLKALYGQTFDLAEVRKVIRPEHRAVYLQATETSTAAEHDIQAIAKLLKEVAPEALLVVDGITGLGTTHFDVDGWGIDILIGGSQKAVMIPPGLAYLSVSDKAWAAMEKARSPRYYFDLRKERKNAVKGESAYTPAVALVAGLGAALDYIAGQAGGDLEKGRIALVNNARVNAAATRAGLVALGFTLFAPTAPAAAATAVAVPEGMNSGDVVKALKAKFALVTANGQGEMQGKIFRVAHLGFFDYLDTIALLGAMEHIAKDTLGLPVEYGKAVAEAQKVYAEAAK
jgi:aspartate aminotransferase-like enzyme